MVRIRRVLGVALLLTLLPMGLASASPAIHIEGWTAAGTLIPGFPTSEPHANGNKCITEFGHNWELYGDIEAVCATRLRIISHAPCTEGVPFPPPARQNATLHAACEGWVPGERYGTFELQGAQVRDPGKEIPLRKELAIGNGEGGLADMHGVLHVQGIPGIAGTYKGIVTFGPDE
jgi:hypothetical protein